MPYLNVYFNNELKSTHLINPIITKIGRYSDNDIVIDNAGVSGHHAVIVKVGEKYVVHDKRSTNGVFVNGELITEKELTLGDEISIFKHKLRFAAINSPLEVSGTTSIETSNIPQNATVEIDVTQLGGLLKDGVAEVASVEVSSGKMSGEMFLLSTTLCCIGKAKACDINIGGWFTPAITAKIIRQTDGYYLIPIKRAKALHNDRLIKSRVKLKHQDNFEIRGTKFSFEIRS